MPYRPTRIGEMSIKQSALVHADNGDKRAITWLESKRTHDKRQRAEKMAARRKRKSKPKKERS